MIVGPHAALAVAAISVSDVNWLGDRPLGAEAQEVSVRIRSTHAPVAATVRAADGAGRALVTFAAPEFGVAPGQAAVFYDGTRVLGGGWIQTAVRG